MSPRWRFWGSRRGRSRCRCQISAGLPKFLVVGLPDKAVAESRERVHAALAAIGLSLPPKRITVNLSPADLPKEGSHYDLPIALGMLAALGAIDTETLAGYVAVGELGLDGRIAPSPGVLLAAMNASARSLGLVCPAAQGAEAAWAGDVEIVAAPDLIALLNHFRGSAVLSPPAPGEAEPPGFGPDLAQVKGQETAKRALEIAAAGGHNLLMVGPPGAGKSLLAACLPGILPELTPPEALEVSMIASVAGTLVGRPADPHPALPRARTTAPRWCRWSAAASRSARARSASPISASCSSTSFPNSSAPPSIRCASRSRPATVSVARANAHVTFPARVQLVAAMNPCRCGHLGDPALACSRAPRCAADYQARVSGPLLDRIDLHVDVQAVAAADLVLPPPSEGSAEVARAGRGRPRRPDRALRRAGHPHQRRGGRRAARGGGDARRARPPPPRPGRRGDAPLRARLPPGDAGGADDRRSGRERGGRAGSTSPRRSATGGRRRGIDRSRSGPPRRLLVSRINPCTTE